jgi:phosphoribosyl 1,2-cyclic phosphate phosphodiesterase
MGATLTFLGTGGSFGVPIIGCRCPSCSSVDRRDQRLRASVFLEWDGTRILIDAGPDFRQQALRENIAALDEVWLTHGHADHTNGIDDLRVFSFGGRTLSVRASATTLAETTSRFRYAFRAEADPSGVSHPLLVPTVIEGEFEVGGRVIVPLPVLHGPFPVTGFRIGNLAYVTDVSTIPDETFELMRGVETLVISALREEPHPTHLTFDQAIEISAKLGAKQVWFTHLAHGLPHVELERRFPSPIRPAYDGLKIELE